MPEIFDFISRVVPWGPDLINLHWKVKGKPFMPGLPFKTPADLLGYAEYALTRPKLYGDLYYCLSSQVKTGKTVGDKTWAYRDHSNVAALQSVWLDLDINDKGYPTVPAALAALQIACTKAQLPIPSAIVSSGGGLHVYWFNDQSLTQDEWRLYSEGLRRVGEAQGLKADWSCTTDSVRVLRIPGTVNHKFDPPRSVKILAFNPIPYAFKSALYAIRAPEGLILHTKRSISTGAVCDFTKFTGRPLVPADDRGIGMDFNEAPLALEPLLGEGGCPHVLDAFQTHGAHYAQPLWHLDALLATFLKDGRRLFHRMSNSHPSYDAGTTDAMFDRKVNEKDERGLGRPSCAAFEGAGCVSCKICSHKGQIRSPLNLTRPAAIPFLSHHETDINVDTSAQVPTSTTPFVVNPQKMPQGFKLNEKGWPCERKPKTLLGGTPHDEWEEIWSTKIWGPYLTSKPDALNFHALVAKDDIRAICIPIEVTNNKEALGACLTKQFIMIRDGKQEATVKFVKAYVEVLKDAEVAQPTTPYGWVVEEGGRDIGFVYSGTMYCRDQTTKPAGRDDKMKDTYKVYGEEGIWPKALNLITAQCRPPLEVIVAASLAAPLLHITGQNGGAIAAIGIGGANKSSAVDVGNAIWGKPVQAKAAVSSSQKGFTKRLGDLHNLPLYWDDVQEGAGLKPAVQALREICGGADGIKLTSGREYAETGTWQSIMTVCANVDLIDELLKTSKTDAARLYRVFQFDVPKAADDAPGRTLDSIARPLLDQLNHNHGHVGARYAKWLGFDPDGVKAVVLMVQNKFTAEVQMRQQERFWVALCACIWAGAYLANEGLDANFHLPELWKFLKEAYFKLRDRVESEQLEGGSVANTEAYLTGFFKEQGRFTLVTWDMIKERGKPTDFLRVIDQPDFVRYPDAHVNVHWVIEDQLLRLSKAAFRSYITEQDTQPSFVLKGLREHFGMREQAKVRLHAGLRTGGGGREPVLVIPCETGWLHDELMSKKPKPLKGEDHQVGLTVGPIINA